jgi:hypothetical protein
MTSYASLISRNLQEVERAVDFPDFKWNGKDYHCVPSSLEVGDMVEIGGKVEEITLSIFVRLPLFLGDNVTDPTQADLHQATLPKSGALVNVGTKPYRVLATRVDPGLAFVKFHLSDQNSSRK